MFVVICIISNTSSPLDIYAHMHLDEQNIPFSVTYIWSEDDGRRRDTSISYAIL